MYEQESILSSIKGLLGIVDECQDFDNQLLIHINSAFMAVSQLGIGPDTPFYVTGPACTWDSFTSDIKLYESVKMYVYFKVKLAFDPPQSSIVTESYKQQLMEIEWRLIVQKETPPFNLDEIERIADSLSSMA